MIFDTDVLIWALRGNRRAEKAIDGSRERVVSVVTYMELIQGAKDKKELRNIRSYLSDLQFGIVPLTENIGHRASVYMEEFFLTHHLTLPDALIAATATETQSTLITGNAKHLRCVTELNLKHFRP